jgi:hypothetical protein
MIERADSILNPHGGRITFPGRLKVYIWEGKPLNLSFIKSKESFMLMNFLLFSPRQNTIPIYFYNMFYQNEGNRISTKLSLSAPTEDCGKPLKTPFLK